MSPTRPDPDHANDLPGPAPEGSTAGSGFGAILAVLVITVIVGFLTTRAYLDVHGYDPSAPPTCGEDVMTTRDRCWYSGHGDGTYDDEVQAAADKHRQDVWIRNIGLPTTGVLLILNSALIVRAVRRARNEGRHHRPVDAGTD